MSAARVIAVAGSAFAGVLAFFVGSWISHELPGRQLHFSNPYALWFDFGIPAPVAAFVATFILTRRPEWVCKLRSLGTLLGIALATTALGCVLYFPLQMTWIAILHATARPGDDWAGSLGSGAFALMAYLDFIAILFGFLPAVAAQFMVLCVARSAAPGEHTLEEAHSQP